VGRADDGSLEVGDESSFPSAVHVADGLYASNVAAVGIYPVHVHHDDLGEDDLLLGDYDGNLEAVEEDILPLVVFYHVLVVVGGILEVGMGALPLKDHGDNLEEVGALLLAVHDRLLAADDGSLEVDDHLRAAAFDVRL
jgi:hypothetical protein